MGAEKIKVSGAAGTSDFPGNPAWGKPLPGGMYAAPTNRVNMYTSRKAGSTANGHGPHACGPYKPAKNGG